MARLESHLWEYNFARVVILDVSSDYELMAEPMPPNCYPILEEKWIHKAQLPGILPQDELLSGYLYDWHESNEREENAWYVGVVRQELAQTLLADHGLA